MFKHPVVQKISKIALVAAFAIVAANIGAPETHAAAYEPKTLGEAIEMAYWYYFLR